MKLTQTRNGQIIVTRQTRNGSQERMGALSTNLNLKDAKAKYHKHLEKLEQEYNSQPNARQLLREAIKNLT